jgi:mannose-6-phosphate isomerase-like protein (cupin superfamily)
MTTSDFPTSSAAPFRTPSFFEFNGDSVEAGLTQGQRSWSFRSQNSIATVTWLSKGEVLENADVPDEHAILVSDGIVVEIAVGAEHPIRVTGPAFVVVPAGHSTVFGVEPGFVLRVFTARSEALVAQTRNRGSYATLDPAVTALPPRGPGREASTLKVHRLADIPPDEERFGRIFRTDALMVNWFEPQVGPRDTDRLTPHSHDDFEQISVTLAGDFVHHMRRPWTSRLADWRPDEHVQVSSPSVTVIPPGIVHTTRAVGHERHQLIDVFAPPRDDFIAQGWVINQGDYA